MEDESRIERLKTFLIVTSFGAKLKGGGNLKETDLWLLKSDKKDVIDVPSWGKTSKEVIEKIKQAHKRNG